MQNNNTILLKFVVENSTLKQDYTNHLCKIQLDQVEINTFPLFNIVLLPLGKKKN